MSKRDKIHTIVVNALINDGWNVTDDPFHLIIKEDDKTLKIDLAAEKIDAISENIIDAEKQEKKIAVEIKSFLNTSILNDVYEAIGQYVVYRSIIRHKKIKRKVYLAVSTITYYRILKLSFIIRVLNEEKIRLVVINPQTEIIKKWIN